MQVFISYSAADTKTVDEIAGSISSFTQVKYWKKSKAPGKDAWETIHSWIDSSNVVLAIITDSTVSRAMAVGQEIGRAISKGKKVIPLVGPGIKSEDLGCLSGISYERIDPNNPVLSMNKIIESLKNEKASEDLIKSLLVISGILYVLWRISK